MSTPIGRRGVLQLLSLATLATTVVACSSNAPERTTPDTAPIGTDEVELVSADVARDRGDDTAVPGVVAAMHATGGALYGSLAADAPGNLAISPYSIAAALALTTNGAVGETKDQLELVFGGTDVATVNPGLNALTAHLESLSGTVTKADGEKAKVALDAANALFGQRGTTWEPPFLETLAASYGAGMNVVDFAGATEAARRAVNAWTAEQTRDKIEEILPTGVVDSMTRLVLVNTLYLKAPWETPFMKGFTQDGPFTLLDGSAVDVPLMGGSDPAGDAYADGDGWVAARMPFAGGAVAMTVVVPDAGKFAEVEQDLVDNGAAAYLEALSTEGVQVTLPSWTFSFHQSLVEPMKGLGVEVPFERGQADFSAMTTDEPLYISAIEHEVFIAVDEDGAEAAAATAVVISTYSAGPEYTRLVVDRPFLFVVHDVEHGTPLFLGRVVDPRGE